MASPRRPSTGRRLPSPNRRRSVPVARPAPASPGGLRIGLGFDAHPLAPGRRLMLGGVALTHDHGLAGHSDADVLSHAICDALLGALGLPDMGTRFPDSDPALRGRSSLTFLREVAGEMRGLGYALVNLDAVVIAEAPRLQPHVAQMRRTLAGALGCEPERIGIKAKRTEGLGTTGRREGILAQAVALLQKTVVPRGRRAGPR